MRVSELVTIEHINSWKNGDIITIEAGTGAGKSYFTKNNLYAVAERDNEKILFLIHRSNCVNQFQMEIDKAKKTGNIHIHTYQSLEAKDLRNEDIDFSKYKYIVCDEFHYFMSDAAFNKFTDISLDAILNQTDKVRIFMSATGDRVRDYIKNKKEMKITPYVIPTDYSFINSLTFYNNDESLDSIVKKIMDTGKKAIFFFQSAEKAYQIHYKYKEISLFNCSKHNNAYYKFVDEKKINTMLQEELFDESILFTTTCMDAGVNIRDKDLQYIICDVKDTGTLVQCIGRKRLEGKDDGIHLFIKGIDNRSLGGSYSKLTNKMEPAIFLMKNDNETYNLKYRRDYDKNNIVYNDIIKGNKEHSELKVNELMLYKCITDKLEIEQMMKQDYGYYKYIARKFGFYDLDYGYSYTIFEDENQKISLEEYLDSILGKKLFKEEQTELKQMFKENGLSAKTLGINTINGNLKDRKLPYTIEIGKRKSYRDEDGNVKKEQSHWVVGKIIYQ